MVTYFQHDPLGAIASRLLNVSSEELLFELIHISNSLFGCSNALCTALTQGKSSPAGLSWHKIKTKITSLLNSKRPEDRWAGTVLIKTIISICAHDILPASGHWVRVLLINLAKSDPSSTKKLVIAVLTQIFLLTDGHQTYIRELTTPSMPTYISACLSLVVPKSATVSKTQFDTIKETMSTVLGSFCILLPKYPTVFRAHSKQIRALLSQVIVPHSPSTKSHLLSALQILSNDQDIQQNSQILLTLLPHCAPKGETGTDWNNCLNSVLSEAHLTASQVFRSVIENWKPLADNDNPNSANVHSSDDQPAMNWSPNFLELSYWSGIQAGCNRLCALVRLLRQLLSGGTPAIVQVSLGRLVNLINRLLSVLPPLPNTPLKDVHNSRNNSQISDDERQILWSETPNIHIATIELMGTVLERFGNLLTNFRLTSIERIATVFRMESYDCELRASLYATTCVLLGIGGQTAQKSQLEVLTPLIRACCNDLLPLDQLSNLNGDNVKDNLKSVTDKKTDLPVMNAESKCSEFLFGNAERLLTTIFANVSSKLIPDSLRTRLDQVSILRGLSSPMVASVLNPMTHPPGAKPRSSILPLLARTDPPHLAVECLVRPRRPLLLHSERHVHLSNGDEISEYGEHKNEVPLNQIFLERIEEVSHLKDSEALGRGHQIDDLETPLESALSSTLQNIEDSKVQESAVASPDLGIGTESLINADKPDYVPLSKRKSILDEWDETWAKKARIQPENGPTAAVEGFSAPQLDEPSFSNEFGDQPVSKITIAPTVSKAQQQGTSLETVHDMSDDDDVDDDDDDDDDDENFVIPPLSMDPDTEEESN